MSENKRTRIQIRNEEKILAAAQDVFATYGFHGATVERVASLAEMSQPNVHHYFKTKADLYIAVLDQTLEIWMEPLGGLNPDGEPEAELRSYIARKMELARQLPQASRIFANEILQGAPVLGPHLKSQVKSAVDAWAVVIRHWISLGKLREVDPYHLIFLIWAATQHYSDFMPQIKAVMGLQKFTRAHFAAAEASITTIILNGLLPRQTTPFATEADAGQGA
jgi:TetR/AcrR family transcriptional regulator